jgi:hypothetical protein
MAATNQTGIPSVMDYTPQQPKPQTAPATEYALVEDVTGKPAPKRGVYILRDGNGTEIKLPHAPKPSCNKCYGRGHVGMDTATKKFIICRKCYLIKQ